ncbi:MAG: hypothetical protein ACE5JP_09870 [Candidatus Bipolaricaulia bacterium]
MDETRVIIDFDGTICDHRFPDVGTPKPDVREALVRIRKLGLKVFIHSVRTASYWEELGLDPEAQRRVIADYMDEHRLPYDGIIVDDKPLAIFYIDDRAIRLDEELGWDWRRIASFVEERWGRSETDV